MKDKLKEIILAVVMSTIALTLTIVMVVNVNNTADSLADKNKTEKQSELLSTETVKHNIDSVMTGSGVEGGFILGTGSFNGETYFLAYEIEEDGGEVLTKYDSSRVKIYQTLDESDKSYVEKTVYKLTGELKECKLYVPKNTIKKETNLNLSNIK